MDDTSKIQITIKLTYFRMIVVPPIKKIEEFLSSFFTST